MYSNVDGLEGIAIAVGYGIELFDRPACEAKFEASGMRS